MHKALHDEFGMLAELFSSSLLSLWLTKAGIIESPASQRGLFPTSVLQPADGSRDRIMQDYLNRLAQQGFSSSQQAVWFQNDRDLLVNHQGQQRQTPASLTKIATTFALIKRLGPRHVFQTKCFATGPIASGVLDGNLVIQAEGDPLLITPEVRTIAGQLNQLGVRRVTGDLVLQGPLSVNFSQDALSAGTAIRQLWGSTDWATATQVADRTVKTSTSNPGLSIAGTVRAESVESAAGTLLLSHASLPLADLLRFMNVYSSNFMAEWFTGLVGGAEAVQTAALESGRVAPSEITLTNGSGLGQENKLSPRAVVGLLQAIQTELRPASLDLANVFPMMGRDLGAIEKRSMPRSTVVKTGTLWNTSGLAGILFTQRYGTVWFAIMNQGDEYTDGFRNAQDKVLQQLVKNWGAVEPSMPVAVTDSLEPRRQAANRFLQADFLTH